MKKFVLSLAATLVCSAALATEKPQLNVYTYDSFASEWGPAPQLEKNFEAVCGCDLNFMPFQDSVTMFNRFRLEGNKAKADVILGIDNFLLPEAEKSGLFAPNQVDLSALTLPNGWTNRTFLPFDFGQYAFIYRKDKLANPPSSLKELTERQDLRVIYQDPRTSSVGRGLLFWLNSVFGDNAAQAWGDLAKHTVTVGKGWSETYGAFLKGESDLVLSYTTSPLYHLWHENDANYVAAEFSEGHLTQVETAAITARSTQKNLAQQFLQFLLTPESQAIIAKSNVMYPVITIDQDPAFANVKAYPTLAAVAATPDQVKQWLTTWQTAVSQ